MRIVSSVLISFFVAGCVTLFNKSKSEFTVDELLKLKISVDTSEVIKKRLGNPHEKIFYSSQVKGGEKSEKWIYIFEKTPKLWLFFKGGILEHASLGVWDRDNVSSVGGLLSQLEGQTWSIVKEPVRNPHSMPNMCMLVSERLGINVKVNSMMRRVDEINLWNPSIKRKIKWFDDSVPEFCIANHCSNVTDPNAWEHNHCEWLEEIVARQTVGVGKNPATRVSN